MYSGLNKLCMTVFSKILHFRINLLRKKMNFGNSSVQPTRVGFEEKNLKPVFEPDKDGEGIERWIKNSLM